MSTDALPDLDACAREPIHVVGSVQPHGFLVTLSAPDMTVVQASANAPPALRAGQDLTAANPDLAAPLADYLRDHGDDEGATYLRTVPVDGVDYELAAHLSGGLLVAEMEEVSPDATPATPDIVQLRLRGFVERLQIAVGIPDLCREIAREVRRLTGFDRALVYRFAPDGHGAVLAEDRNDVLPSYVELRFPASDIPAQARELYRRNRLRIIPDASYVPVPIVPVTTPSGQPLDLSQSVLRSVSPVHVEYMRNMGTMSSMSVSIIVDGRLWGLVSCHGREPRRVSLQARNTCDFLTRIFALQVAAHERGAHAEEKLRLGAIQAQLLAFMAEEESFVDALVRNPREVLAFADAAGAAIISTELCALIGDTPPEDDVRALHGWLSGRARGFDDVLAVDLLADVYPPAAAYSDVASGVLAISVSRTYGSYVVWFRPEVVRSVNWAGNPSKLLAPDPAGGPDRLHPRKSFEIWKETVRGQSQPWSPAVIEAAGEFRSSIQGVVLRRAEDLASVSEELKRSNKELEAFSYSVSHDLRAPFRHIVGYSELLKGREWARLSEKGRHYVDTIIEAAFSAGTLVDKLLAFSQMGRNSLNRMSGDMNSLVEDVRRRIARDIPPDRTVTWQVEPLGRAYADPVMMRLAIENLLSNAVKYTRAVPEAHIEIGRLPSSEGEAIFFVRDNGVGFDMAYVDKLFGVFQRLHRIEDYEGTGIGLANVRRIVERHGGRTWAEGELGVGATFFISLPTRERGDA